MLKDTRYSYFMINFKAKTTDGEIIKSALSHMNFPAGEAHTKREERRELEPIEIAIIQTSAESMHDDLFQLAMWNDYILQENADRPVEYARSKRVLILPYMPGARADRGQPLGLGIYAGFIRNLELNHIILFDPHSGMTGDELHAAADSMTIVDSCTLLALPHVKSLLGTYDAVIAPDKGAVRRAYLASGALDTSLLQAEKTRDFESGKLSGFHIENIDPEKRYLVVDDICDGGGTFMGLAEATGLPKENLDLYVSHGVFSKNAYFNLSKHYGNVFTTNSFIPEISVPNFLFKRNSRTMREAANFVHFDVIHLLMERI